MGKPPKMTLEDLDDHALNDKDDTWRDFVKFVATLLIGTVIVLGAAIVYLYNT